MITRGTHTAAVYKQFQPYMLYEGCKLKNGLNVVYDFNFRRVNLNKKTIVQHCDQSL